MNKDLLDTEIRQFLRKAGISIKREIEQAIYAAIESDQISGAETMPIKLTLCIPDLDLHHPISGHIKLEYEQ